MFDNNLIALGVTLVIALVWLRVNDFAAHKGWISSSLSRKIIHIGTGPIFVLCWLFFNDSPTAPYIAAVVPLGITAQFALVGTGILKDPSARIKEMKREMKSIKLLLHPIERHKRKRIRVPEIIIGLVSPWQLTSFPKI